jgi:hypothetical protein
MTVAPLYVSTVRTLKLYCNEAASCTAIRILIQCRGQQGAALSEDE